MNTLPYHVLELSTELHRLQHLASDVRAKEAYGKVQIAHFKVDLNAVNQVLRDAIEEARKGGHCEEAIAEAQAEGKKAGKQKARADISYTVGRNSI